MSDLPWKPGEVHKHRLPDKDKPLWRVAIGKWEGMASGPAPGSQDASRLPPGRYHGVFKAGWQSKMDDASVLMFCKTLEKALLGMGWHRAVCSAAQIGAGDSASWLELLGLDNPEWVGWLKVEWIVGTGGAPSAVPQGIVKSLAKQAKTVTDSKAWEKWGGRVVGTMRDVGRSVARGAAEGAAYGLTLVLVAGIWYLSRRPV